MTLFMNMENLTEFNSKLYNSQLNTLNGINTEYNVQFSVTTENGCNDSDNIELTLYPTPSIEPIELDTVLQMRRILWSL